MQRHEIIFRVFYVMKNLRRYIKKADQFVIAVQLNLDTDGFTYDKWGSVQKCKKGD